MKTNKKTSDFEKNAIELQRAAAISVANCGKNAIRQARLNALKNAVYTENDLRGLTVREKEFIRENEMKAFYCEHTYTGGNARYFVFIGRNATTGKRQLYAYSVRQMLNVNGRDISPWVHNYACWLTPQLYKNSSLPVFSAFRYEVRPWDVLTEIFI